MNLTFQIYDAFGDWISANGLIRHLAEGYETVTLIHDTPAVVPFTTDMFRDNPKIKAIVGTPSGDCDVVVVECVLCPTMTLPCPVTIAHLANYCAP